MTDTLFISRCPLTSCHWESEPCTTKNVAEEALRLHLTGHTHGDLIGFAMLHVTTDHYQKFTGSVR